MKFELAQRSDTAHLVDEMIDIKPHPPYGTKAARRAAKERAAERAREREMERQRAAGANPTNFYACELTQLRLHAFLSRIYLKDVGMDSLDASRFAWLKH